MTVLVSTKKLLFRIDIRASHVEACVMNICQARSNRIHMYGRTDYTLASVLYRLDSLQVPTITCQLELAYNDDTHLPHDIYSV